MEDLKALRVNLCILRFMDFSKSMGGMELRGNSELLNRRMGDKSSLHMYGWYIKNIGEEV